MRSIKRELEEQRSVLTSAIKSPGSDRTADHGREIVKDPYGSASITHDDEVSFAVIDSARDSWPRSRGRWKTTTPDAMASAASAATPSPIHG